MIFNEIYGSYYNAVAEILKAAVKGDLRENNLKKIIEKHAFSESHLTIIPALKNEKWQLLREDMSTPITHKPTLPITDIQKRWLKAILSDPRVKLFDIKAEGLEDVTPLFAPDDYVIFDKYSDGDNFKDPKYIERFKSSLKALKGGYPLKLEMLSGKGKYVTSIILPQKLEYSEKDDKFRLLSTVGRQETFINLGRITSCRAWMGEWGSGSSRDLNTIKTVTFRVFDERNALERVMLHFAHFDRESEKLGGNEYRLKIRYYSNDETEIVIRTLSFGPFIKVEEPESFVDLIKERLRRQKSCEL